MSNETIIIRYIETTGRCNMNCRICTPRIRNFDMDEEDYRRIIEINADILNGQAVWLDFNGEPLVDTHIFDRIRAIKAIGAQVRLSTNGTLLNTKTIDNLIRSNPDMVSVSIMTLDSSQYKEFHETDGFQLVLDNLLALKRLVNKEDAKITVQAVMIDLGDHKQSEHFINFFHSYGIDVALHKFTHRAKTVKNVYPHKVSTGIRKACEGRLQNLAILADCSVVLCCCDYVGRSAIGNLRDYGYSVKQLVAESKILRDFLLNQQNSFFSGICHDCDDWQYFQTNSTEEYVSLYFCNKR